MSRLGGNPHLLQNEPLETEGRCVLQVCAGSLPTAHAGASGLADAVCSLHASDGGGLFFVQVT